jgi:hypothetical protein
MPLIQQWQWMTGIPAPEIHAMKTVMAPAAMAHVLPAHRLLLLFRILRLLHPAATGFS